MNNKEFGQLFQQEVNEYFAGKTPTPSPDGMDAVIKRFSVASRQDGRQKWERENPLEKTVAERMKAYEQGKVKD